MVSSLRALNLQQSRGCWLRNRLEVATAFELYIERSGSSFGTFFLWRGGQVDHESIHLGL